MYGNPLWWTWDGQRAPEFEKYYQEWYLTELRWCIMGIKDPETGQGFGSKTKVLSSTPLWSGLGTPDKCQCLAGPGHVKEPLTVLKREQRLRVEAWTKISHYIFALCFSCNPLGYPGTCSSGIRLELNESKLDKLNNSKKIEFSRDELILSPDKLAKIAQ